MLTRGCKFGIMNKLSPRNDTVLTERSVERAEKNFLKKVKKVVDKWCDMRYTKQAVAESGRRTLKTS